MMMSPEVRFSPSRTAELSPRSVVRTIRLTQGRLSCWITSSVPSRLLSSTIVRCKYGACEPFRAASRSMRSGMLRASLKVGTTTSIVLVTGVISEYSNLQNRDRGTLAYGKCPDDLCHRWGFASDEPRQYRRPWVHPYGRLFR